LSFPARRRDRPSEAPPPVNSLGATSGTQSIGTGETKTLITINTPGQNLHLHCWSDTSQMRFQIICDGLNLLIGTGSYFSAVDLYLDGYVASTPGVSLLKYNATDGYDNIFIITLPFAWRQKLEVKASNPTASTRTAVASINYLRFL